MHHAKSHRVCRGHHEMNHAHARSHPAMQRQLGQDQHPTFQAMSQDRMWNRTEQVQEAMEPVEMFHHPTQEG
eukprot:g16191.t1